MSEIIEYRGYKINIVPDHHAMDPRKEWDCHIGKMWCWHKRYELGDEDPYKPKTEYFDGWDEIKDHIRKENDGIIILPLSLYDHSGISMSVGSPTCRWDSGYVGFIFATRDAIRKVCPDWKIITRKRREQIVKWLESEVETYDQYLRGEVYGYQITKDDGGILDSCSGYYGDDHKESGLLEAAQEWIDWELKDTQQRRIQALKTLIRNRVPLDKRQSLLEDAA